MTPAQAFREAEISIHAAREGGDYNPLIPSSRCRYFNPRRP